MAIQGTGKRLGIWIDHKEATLVFLTNGDAQIKRIESNADSNVRSKGGYKSGGTSVAQSVSNEQKIGERRKHQLHGFYEKVGKAASNAQLIYIFGPGSARNELEKEMKKMKLHDRIKTVESSDSMTENQKVAKVKSFFNVSDERF
ncbi:MAG: hypothetical protein HKN33_18415 [Pyrinomonadaceae bacterium]|nr:hypothetical protein [Pyrinomonadaceae bacterium]